MATGLFGSGGSATFSPCGTFRYTLERIWSDGEAVVFIMLNPSTADAEKDDPTIRRCIAFARQWGFGGLIVCNLFALRSTNPKRLYSAPDPIGPENDAWLVSATAGRHAIAAWGVHGALQGRGRRVAELIRSQSVTVQCLGTTKEGHPRHPLYVAGVTERSVYRSEP